MENLSRTDLFLIARKIRGRRDEIANLAGVTRSIVDNTFLNRSPNRRVLEVALEIIRKDKEQDTLVNDLRTELVSS